MKPYVLCHMLCSVDGRILGSRWRPKNNVMPGLFEKLHDQLVAEPPGGGSWLCGRVTAQEFARGKTEPAYPPSDQKFPRTPWFASRDVNNWGIFLDAHGKAVWRRADCGGDAVLGRHRHEGAAERVRVADRPGRDHETGGCEQDRDGGAAADSGHSAGAE